MRLCPLIVLLSVVTLAPHVRADDPAPAGAPGGFPAAAEGKVRTGSFQLPIPERSKNSNIFNVCTRVGWGTRTEIEAASKKDGKPIDYDLANETFEAYVPEDYTGDEPYGLIVWVSPGPSGSVHRQWLDVLRKHKLIWVGADNSGNDRIPRDPHRPGNRRGGIHAEDVQDRPVPRLCVGRSGGGRCSSTLAFAFPEIFTGGGYPIIGINFYRRVEVGPAANGGTEFYPQGLKPPPGKLAQVMKKERRFVLLTGDNDMNRKETNLYADAMKKDGFKYVTYIQVPGMGHQPPDAEWFEKGIIALDEPRDAIANAEASPRGEGGPGRMRRPRLRPVRPLARRRPCGAALQRPSLLPTTRPAS